MKNTTVSMPPLLKKLVNHLPGQIGNTKFMMEERFANCKKFSFLDLVNPKLFPQWKDKIPSDMLVSLKSAYCPLFDLQFLRASCFSCIKIISIN